MSEPVTRDARPAVERVAELRRRILEAVEAGRFRLLPPGGWIDPGADCGCAVEAAASAMGVAAETPAQMYRRYHSGLTETGIATDGERDELEAGFEDFTALDEGPFYRLGTEIRSLAAGREVTRG